MWLSGFGSAWRFLTRVPLPAFVPGSWQTFDRALPWFPWVGLVLGGALLGADTLLGRVSGPFLASALAVALLAALTGALHLDGLADTADAVFAHASPERRLEIMRDVHVGAFGTVAVALVLLMKAAALADTVGGGRGLALVAAPVLGRWAIVLAAALFPYGRAEGLGSPLRAAAAPGRVALAAVPVVLLALIGGPVGVALATVSTLAAWLVGRWLMARLPNGLTGDCYGATCEVVEALALSLAGPLLRLGLDAKW